MLGILTLALVNVACEMSEAVTSAVHNVGKLWMPGAEGIGPYSGKETISLVVWLVSWVILHRLLRAKEWAMQVVVAIFLLGIGVATTLLWPPVFYLFSHHW